MIVPVSTTCAPAAAARRAPLIHVEGPGRDRLAILDPPELVGLVLLEGRQVDAKEDGPAMLRIHKSMTDGGRTRPETGKMNTARSVGVHPLQPIPGAHLAPPGRGAGKRCHLLIQRQRLGAYSHCLCTLSGLDPALGLLRETVAALNQVQVAERSGIALRAQCSC